jgi:group I intron endonuclease
VECVCGIYCIENLINGKKYIGQTKNYFRRIMGHKSLLRGGYDGCSYLQNAWNKYGEENFKFYMLIKCVDNKELLDKLEIFYIKYYNTNVRDLGYNITSGGGGTRNLFRTEKQRAAQSIRMSGENHPLYMVPMSQETKDKISLSHKDKSGHPMTEKCKDALFVSTAGIKKAKNTSSKYVGVCYNKKNYNWTSQIGYLGKLIYLGTFEYEYQAAEAYNKNAIELYGKDFPINEILEDDIKYPIKNIKPKNEKFNNNYRGVFIDNRDNKFNAAIRKDNIVYHLGYFDNEIEAAIAYNEAAIEFYGTKAKLNNISEEEYNSVMINS